MFIHVLRINSLQLSTFTEMDIKLTSSSILISTYSRTRYIYLIHLFLLYLLLTSDTYATRPAAEAKCCYITGLIVKKDGVHILL